MDELVIGMSSVAPTESLCLTYVLAGPSGFNDSVLFTSNFSLAREQAKSLGTLLDAFFQDREVNLVIGHNSLLPSGSIQCDRLALSNAAQCPHSRGVSPVLAPWRRCG